MENLSEPSIYGEYYLRGLPELATGFKINSDKTFNFFLSYGALDRYGNGVWHINNNQVIFNSDKWIGHDFQLLESKSVDSEKIVIEMVETNPAIFSYIFASLRNGQEDSWQHFNKEGMIYLEKEPFSSISLAFEFCPERFSQIQLDTDKYNYFRFKTEAWLFEYFFIDFSLSVKEDGLWGKNPILDDKEYLYLRHT